MAGLCTSNQPSCEGDFYNACDNQILELTAA